MGFFVGCIDFYSCVEKLEILVFFKNVSQIANLKVEHCGYLYLVAYLYRYNSLFIFQIFHSFLIFQIIKNLDIKNNTD